MRSGPPSSRRGFGAAGLLLAAAAVLGALVPMVFGAPQALVHITWKNIPDAERVALEQRYRLEEPEQVSRSTWAYAPRVTTPDLLRQLISDPSIDDTAGIDRPALRIASNAPLTPRRGGLITAPRTARVVKGVVYGMGLAAVLWLLLAASREAYARRDSLSVSAIVRAISRGVPMASPHAAAAFRIVFMSAALLVVAREPVAFEDVQLGLVADARGLLGMTTRWLVAHPAITDAIQPVLYVSGALAVAGAAGQVSLAVFVAAFFLWASLLSLGTAYHTIVSLQLALIGLLGARWTDAWSVDAWLRKGAVPAPDRRYGYAIWLPGFVLGVGFLAAAWAKMEGGPAWILNGSVKYHFVSDLDQAWVKWAPSLTAVPGVAIAMSAVAVLIESVVIAASFTRSATRRMLVGLLGLPLLAGFALFQGVVWPGWWMLLLSFLPWQAIGRREAAPGSVMAMQPLQVALVCLIVAQQVLVSATGRDVAPVLSTYDMYATTYSTPDEYEWASNLEYRLVAERGGEWRDVDGCVFDDGAALRVRDALAAGRPVPESIEMALARCLARVPGATAARLEGDRRVFDWEAKVFSWKRRIDVVGPIDISR